MKRTFHGVPASPGIGIGKILRCHGNEPIEWKKDAESVQTEWKRFLAAVEQFHLQAKRMAERVALSAGASQAEILQSQGVMAEDPVLREGVWQNILDGACAETALDAACDLFIEEISASENEMTRLRADDVRDMRNGMLRILLDLPDVDFSQLEEGTVLLAEELSPSAVSSLDPSQVTGVILSGGGLTSHTVILLRSMEIPVVIGAKEACESAADGEDVVLDGSKGLICLDPGEDGLELYRQEWKEYLRFQESLKGFIGKATVTSDGEQVWLGVNVGSETDVLRAGVIGCDGVGLFRSEFLYQGRETPPEEEEQFRIYRRMALAMHGQPLVIRTLDAGGDKPLPWITQSVEKSPALGCRGIRLSLRNEEMFLCQIRAILRAGAFGDVRLLLPMITGLEEVLSAKELVERAKAELRREREAFSEKLPIGVMIETPAAIFVTDHLAKEADFFSVGTNDLTQYLVAADRENANVQYLASHCHPAVLRALQHAVLMAQQEGVSLGICGEAAADPAVIPLFLALGIRHLSVLPAAVLSVRKTISLWSMEEAEKLLEQALSLESEKKLRALLEDNIRK